MGEYCIKRCNFVDRSDEKRSIVCGDAWHRLERVIKWTGLSVNSFALNIGLKRSENLYQIKRGNNGISRDLAELIAAKYPSVSKGLVTDR